MKVLPINIDAAAVETFCKRHGVARLSLFGSVMREDFGPASDVDVLIRLQPGVSMTLEAHLAMREELSAMFGGRAVDMVREEYLKNPHRKAEILRSREVIYGGQ